MLEAATDGVLLKNGVLSSFHKINRKTPRCLSIFFNKVAGLRRGRPKVFSYYFPLSKLCLSANITVSLTQLNSRRMVLCYPRSICPVHSSRFLSYLLLLSLLARPGKKKYIETQMQWTMHVLVHTRVDLYRSSHQRCSTKKVFWKISQNSS